MILANKYNFNYEEAIKYINNNTNTNKNADINVYTNPETNYDTNTNVDNKYSLTNYFFNI